MEVNICEPSTRLIQEFVCLNNTEENFGSYLTGNIGPLYYKTYASKSLGKLSLDGDNA